MCPSHTFHTVLERYKCLKMLQYFYLYVCWAAGLIIHTPLFLARRAITVASKSQCIPASIIQHQIQATN